MALVALLGGCAPSDIRSEWAGRYKFAAIGSDCVRNAEGLYGYRTIDDCGAPPAVNQGYIQIEKDGRFVAVNLPHYWRDTDEGVVEHGRFVADVDNGWPSILFGYGVDRVAEQGHRGQPLIDLYRNTKSITFYSGSESRWVRYEAAR